MHTEPAAAALPLFRSDGTPPPTTVTLRFEGRPITAPAGTSIAAALLLNCVGPFRTTPVSASPRSPYCMMGVCFECLVEVDGEPSRQACLVPIREGMIVKRQQGASALGLPMNGECHGR